MSRFQIMKTTPNKIAGRLLIAIATMTLGACSNTVPPGGMSGGMFGGSAISRNNAIIQNEYTNVAPFAP